MRVRAPLWARKKDRRKRSFLVPRGALPPPAASRLPPRGRLGEDPQTPSRHRFPVALTIFVYRPSCLRSRAHGRLHVTPPLNPLPRGGDFGAQMGPPTPAADDYPFFDRTRACIGPIGGPIQAFFALFARKGPINGPIRAPLGETREESDSQHVASNKNGLFCSLRNAPARRRERFQGFLLLAGGSGPLAWEEARTTLTFSLYFRETGSWVSPTWTTSGEASTEAATLTRKAR